MKATLLISTALKSKHLRMDAGLDPMTFEELDLRGGAFP